VVANVVRDFEPELSSLTVRPFDDGRFIILLNGKRIYDMDRTGRFPNYDNDLKPKLSGAA
jgi:predicted Rdx family selenoprotein